MNAIPYVIPYGGKKTDVFSAEDVADIDRLYASFTKKVLELTAAKNLRGRLGGEVSWWQGQV